MHALVRQDPRLKPILELTGMPALRQREPGFAGLAAIVCGQQLSTASAAAIWKRVSAAIDPFHHDAIRKVLFLAVLASWCPRIMVRLGCRATVAVPGVNFMPSGSVAEGTEPLSSGLESRVARCRVPVTPEYIHRLGRWSGPGKVAIPGYAVASEGGSRLPSLSALNSTSMASESSSRGSSP